MNEKGWGLRRGSLGRKILVGVVLGELLFSLLLGVTIAAYSVRSAAQARQSQLSAMGSVIAAGLMPVVADQQEPQVRAQMQSILDTANARDIEYIEIVDSAGMLIASDEIAPASESTDQLLGWLGTEQVTEESVMVDGLEVARVKIRFAAIDPSELLTAPMLAAAIVVLAVVLVSVPWTAWLFARGVSEPLGELEAVAARIAEGEWYAPEDMGASTLPGEIGMLQQSLATMSGHIRGRDEELRQSLDELSEAYASLERAKAEVETMARMKSDFVAVASHEIRTPLATISLYSELLEGGEVCTLDEAGLDAVAAIGSASARLGSIVSDLMDSALLERGLLHLEFGDVWIDDLLSRAVDDAAAVAAPRGVTVGFEGPLPESVIRGDALRLRQVLDNLISNAVKYSDGAKRVSVSAIEFEDHLDIEVVDRGRGVPADGAERLFTLFGRLDSGDNRDTAGLGLGLAISARIVEAHRGTITYFDNPEGAGTVFRVRLPLKGVAAGTTRSMVQVVSEDEDDDRATGVQTTEESEPE